MAEQLKAIIQTGGNADSQINQINALVSTLIQSISDNNGESAADLTAIVTRLLADDVQQHIMKSCILCFSKALKDIPLSSEVKIEILSSAIAALKSSAINFDDCEYYLRDNLFNAYISVGEYRDAALTLSGINLESTARVFNDVEKTDIYVKCAEAFLADDEPIDAEVFVNKAGPYINDITDIGLQLRYKATSAKVLDANKKFVDAAIKYYELSSTTAINVVQEDLIEFLGNAVTCAVLGKASAQKRRVLGLLYQDERFRTLDQYAKYTSHVSMLTKMYLDHIIRKEELVNFEGSLSDHQKARSADNYTLLEKAVIEHNMLAVSKIYMNISFTELSSLLRVDVRQTEKLAAKMICDERLSGSIDQIEGILYFTSIDDDAAAVVAGDSITTTNDNHVKNICNELATALELCT